jgi:hypothetical protein
MSQEYFDNVSKSDGLIFEFLENRRRAAVARVFRLCSTKGHQQSSTSL